MKYTRGLSESIRRDIMANIEDATVKAMSIEGKYLMSDKGDDKIKSGYKSSWKNEQKGEAKGEGSSSKEFYCNHCKASGHLSNYCWKLHPELRPKEEKRNKEKYTLAAEVVDLPDLDKPNPKLTLMFQRTLVVEEESREEIFHVSIQVK
ncbi:hypothetical protein GIB67_043118 [Kingdonia uniflora]|uniref:Uncharacterized protein n=1 Tax=Kingdonia uniflora TaxID=39325 RepID=A0A7J7NJA8_9MAGN|nr:hypothetical protein GIB67_043118 [Kingdonia uniflora]